MKKIVAQNIFNCFSHAGNHVLCQDYSFWSSIENCITDPNEVDKKHRALYPYARKCIAHEKYQNKSQASTKNSCGKYGGQNSATHPVSAEILDICPNSAIETDCKGNEFFCNQSKSCVEKAKICDGIVHCIFGEDEDWDLCKTEFKFDEAATIECNQSDRGSFNLPIKATPCNGIRECSDINDEDCGESRTVLIISIVIAFVLILALCIFIHYKTITKYPTQISDDPEFIDDETAKYCSNLKGNRLAQIKVCKKLILMFRNVIFPYNQSSLLYLFFQFRMKMIQELVRDY